MMSLVDEPDSYIVDVWAVFYDTGRGRSQFWKLLKPRFRHVEIWREDRGAWARVDPCLEFMVAEVYLQPPWETGIHNDATYVRVRRFVPRGKVREWWAFGPVTCVELSKAMLGIRAPFVRTPYGLYKHLRKIECSSSLPVLHRVRSWLSSIRGLLRLPGDSLLASLRASRAVSNEHAGRAEGRSGNEGDACSSDRAACRTG